MAKKYKTVMIPARPAKESQTLDKVVCDICGKETDDDSNWTGNRFGRSEIDIEWTEGQMFPNAEGDGIRVKIDLCPVCFEEKLMPFIESFGMVKLEREYWSTY